MVYNYVNFINIFYDKELLALNYSKLNAFILIHCGLYIIYITICFNTFEAYFSYISHILTIIIIIIILLFIFKYDILFCSFFFLYFQCVTSKNRRNFIEFEAKKTSKSDEQKVE